MPGISVLFYAAMAEADWRFSVIQNMLWSKGRKWAPRWSRTLLLLGGEIRAKVDAER